MVLQGWYPESPPTWTDVVIAFLSLVWVPLHVIEYLETIYWSWSLLGLVIGLILIGPLANSPMGEQAGAWFKNIGVLGRVISLLLFLGIVMIIASQVNIPSEIVGSYVCGSVISVFLYVLSHIIYSGKISGWE